MSWLTKMISAITLAFGVGSADPACPKEPAKPITVEQLGQMLQDSGFAVEPQEDGNGVITGYKIEIESGDHSVPVYFQFSDDKMSITVTAELSPLDDMESVPAAALAALLQRNNLNNSPFVVGINEHSVVTLQLTQDAKGLSDDALWNLIERLQETIDQSAELWAVDALTPPALPPHGVHK